MTPFLDIESAPFERLTERIIGKSSGVKPTARATAKRSDCNTPCLKSAFMKKTNKTRRKVTSIIKKPNFLSPLSNSVSRSLAMSPLAIFPYSVKFPVFNTTAVAVPLTTEVPKKRQLFHSVMASPFTFKGAAVFSTGNDSPVSAD